nr:nitronate monooxygenase [Candidatus Microthrix sp.]
MISTRLTELLDIEAPVMLAGMGGVSYHELAAAVSNAGGFGCLGASTMSDEVMVERSPAPPPPPINPSASICSPPQGT